jgi:RimJ/RimL family protein N-acetyltransferase
MTMELRTGRLLLDPFREADAAEVAALAGNWKVARMTARIPHPYSEDLARQWIAGQETARASGGVTFAIRFGGGPVGAVGLERMEPGQYELGYWIGEPWWGIGIATEAAHRTLRFAFEDLAARAVIAGYLFDNPASGRVLAKCGFARTGEIMQWCEARGQAVKCHRLTLAAADMAAADMAAADMAATR